MKEKILNKKIFIIISIILIFIVVYLVTFFSKKLDEFKIKDALLYQYLSGIKYELDGNIKLNKNNEIIELTFKENTIDLDSTPLYYQEDDRVIFPYNMSLVYPTSGVQKKVNFYSSVNNDGTTNYVTDRNKKHIIDNCFLYDGGDLYFFVSEVTLKYKDQEIKLSPLSYVVVNHQTNIFEYYDYKTDTYTVIDNLLSEVIAESELMKVNLSLDLIYVNEKSRLLIKNIDVLKNLDK